MSIHLMAGRNIVIGNGVDICVTSGGLIVLDDGVTRQYTVSGVPIADWNAAQKSRLGGVVARRFTAHCETETTTSTRFATCVCTPTGDEWTYPSGQTGAMIGATVAFSPLNYTFTDADGHTTENAITSPSAPYGNSASDIAASISEWILGYGVRDYPCVIGNVSLAGASEILANGAVVPVFEYDCLHTVSSSSTWNPGVNWEYDYVFEHAHVVCDPSFYSATDARSGSSDELYSTIRGFYPATGKIVYCKKDNPRNIIVSSGVTNALLRYGRKWITGSSWDDTYAALVLPHFESGQLTHAVNTETCPCPTMNRGSDESTFRDPPNAFALCGKFTFTDLQRTVVS